MNGKIYSGREKDLSYLVVRARMRFLDLSEKVGLRLMSGPIRSGESSMICCLLSMSVRVACLLATLVEHRRGAPVFLYITVVSHELRCSSLSWPRQATF